MKKYLLLIFFLLCACGENPTYPPPPQGYTNAYNPALSKGMVEIRFIDVGEGDATLITTPNKRAILIDAGTATAGREAVLPILENTGITLELIIASHYDADHIGGIPGIIRGMDNILGTGDDIIPSRGVLDRGGPKGIETAEVSDYFVTVNNCPPPLSPLPQGEGKIFLRYSLEPRSTFEIDGVEFEILAQNGCFSDGYCEGIEDGDENAHSMSILVRYNNITYLTSGDLPGPNFKNIYVTHDLERHIPDLVDGVDILHVGHHGSHNSTSKEFVDALKPDTAIISVGDNDYGHPSPIVLKNLLAIGTQIHLTEGNWIGDKDRLSIADGDIVLKSDGTRYFFENCM